MTVSDLIELLEKLPRESRVLVPAFRGAGFTDVEGVEALGAKPHITPGYGERFFDAEDDLVGSFPAVLIK